MISKEQLDIALAAWREAHDRSILEQHAWGTLNQSHWALISSLLQHGHTWDKAQAEFEKLTDAHRESFVASLRAMQDRADEYNNMLRRFHAQSGGKTA